MKKNGSKERKKVRAELKCIELSLVCAGYDSGEKMVVFRETGEGACPAVENGRLGMTADWRGRLVAGRGKGAGMDCGVAGGLRRKDHRGGWVGTGCRTSVGRWAGA